MIDYQRIVEFLRDFRAQPGQAVTDEVRRYAAEYAERCAQANERLRQCSVFLQQGLRSEAINLADKTPNLLELVAALDLPDAAGWAEFCQQNELPVPPPLQIERANRLNEGYGQEQPAEHLLRRHRLLALCRAPIKDRLETIRQLAATDQTSGFWEKDIRVFEKARLKELKHDFAEALENRDGPLLENLSVEVLKSPWLEEPGRDLLAAAHGADNHMKLVTADVKLREVMASLRKAFAARDLNECNELVQQIPAIIAEANKQGVSSETAAELKPIMYWIKQETTLLTRKKEIAAAEGMLAQALDADAPDGQLESQYRKILSYEEPLPPELEDRYQRTMKNRHRAAQRKYVIILATVAAIVLLAGGGVYLNMRSRVASGWVNRIHQANASRDVTLARQLIDEQEHRAAQFNNLPELISAKQETKDLQIAYDADKKHLDEKLAELNTDEIAGEQLESSKDAKIDDLLSVARSIEQAAGAGADTHLAWVDIDHKLPDMLRRLQDLAGDLHKTADKKATDQSASVASRIDALNAADADAAKTLESLAAELDSLHRLDGLGKDAAAVVATAGDKLSARRAAMNKDMDQAQRLAALHHAALSVDSWKKELQSFVDAYPDAPETQDFIRAIKSIEGSASVESLQNIESPWAGKFEVNSEQAARERLDVIKAYIVAHPHSPYRKSVAAYSNYLQQAAGAMAPKSSWPQGFASLLSNPLITELKYLTASDGSKYYILGDIHLVSQQIGAEQKISFNVIDPNNLDKPKKVTLANSVTLKSTDPTLTPHALFAQSLDAQLKKVGPDNWNTLGFTLIDKILQNTDMDPIVRGIFLQQALKSTSQIAGWGLGGAYDSALLDFNRQDVEAIAWYDLSKPISEAKLASLKQTMDSLPKTDAVRKSLIENQAKLFNDVRCRFAIVGTLLRNPKGEWTISPSPVDAGSIAWAVGPLPDAADQPAALRDVAHFENGNFQINAAAVSDLPQGTLVFIGK